jgi:hypothetical protein
MLSPALVLGVLLLPGSSTAAECATPPSRVSEFYWSFVESCGCEKLTAPSKASPDYGRFLKACKEWWERNRPVVVVVASPSPSTAGSPSPSPAPVVVRTPRPAECGEVPSRVSALYWEHLEACGCEGAEAPSRASDDYPRYEKACAGWRQRNQPPVVVVPQEPPASPSPAP